MRRNARSAWPTGTWPGAAEIEYRAADSALRRVPNAPLTIVIPVLNERRLIASLLESLVPFRQRNVEVVVVDGAATMALTAAGLSR